MGALIDVLSAIGVIVFGVALCAGLIGGILYLIDKVSGRRP